MTHCFFRKLVLSFLLLTISPPMVLVSRAASTESYEEVTYDELLSELNTKRAAVESRQKAPRNALSLGVGYVHSLTQLNIRHTTSERSQDGLQIAATMNLDSPHLYAEGVFRNFSGSTLPGEDLQILQVDSRLGYSNAISGQWTYNLFTGFSGRLIQASHSLKNYSINEFTPSFTAGAGAMAEIHKNIRLGFELGGRTSILGKNTDQNSMDFALRLDTTL